MKKKHPIHFLVLLLPGLLYSQNTFNRRFDFGFPAAVLTGIIATDSCYYATGIIADSIPPYNTGSLFCRFSLDGQPQLVNTIESTSKTYETWFGGLKYINNSFAAMGYTTDNIYKSLLVIFNDLGDSLWTKSIYHPDGPLSLKSLVETTSGFYLLHHIGSGTNTQIYLVKTDLEGHTQWSKTYGASNRNEYPYSIADTGDGLVIGASRSNGNITNQNYIVQDYIFKVDYEGNVLWSYYSPANVLSKLDDILVIQEGSILVISADGIEVPINPGMSEVQYHPKVYKLSADREMLWERSLKDSLPAEAFLNNLEANIELSDGSGYVVAGNMYEHQTQGVGLLSGVIAKLSPEGALLWKHYLRWGYDRAEAHYLYDIAETPDGGFILAGQVNDRGDPVKATFQQAWLLKVDEQGCLVPGCLQLSKAEEAPATAAMPQVLLWPNPVQEVLSVYCQAQSELQLEIWDMQGRMWRRCSSGLPQVSLALDVAELPAGQYVLRYRDEAGQMGSTPFVKGGM